MNVYSHFRGEIAAILQEFVDAGKLPAGLPVERVTVEPPREAAHGDLATNAAMVLAKPANVKPRELAEQIAERLRARPEVEAVEVAGPGFVNMRIAADFWRERVRDILEEGVDYGATDLGRGEAINVEFVSANPTGPLHVGHGRGAVMGDALAELLAKMGYAVTREYYINDAGGQVEALARSVHLRYREALGETVMEFPEGLYPGDYLKLLGEALAERDGRTWLEQPEAEWLPVLRQFAVDRMMDLIREDLAAMGIGFDVFTSERGLVEAGAVDRAMETLQSRDLLYTGVLEPPKGKPDEDWEPREQLLFRSTRYGDDVDRPIRKSDGSWTYFASDVAYHEDKYRRGFRTMIDVWGADHGGYVKRMRAAVKAVTAEEGDLDVKLCQLVNLLNRGEPVRMSKRAGTFVTLREVVDEVGKDVVRFIMLTRKNDAALDFDLAKVTEQSRDNPVFYVQYAHARHRSVFRNAAGALTGQALDDKTLAGADLRPLTHPAEIDLIRLLAGWPRTLEGAAEAHEPHRLAFYMYDVASAFHGLWTLGKEDESLRFIIEDDWPLSLARLALVRAVGLVIASGLRIFGVEPVEEMR